MKMWIVWWKKPLESRHGTAWLLLWLALGSVAVAASDPSSRAVNVASLEARTYHQSMDDERGYETTLGMEACESQPCRDEKQRRLWNSMFHFVSPTPVSSVANNDSTPPLPPLVVEDTLTESLDEVEPSTESDDPPDFSPKDVYPEFSLSTATETSSSSTTGVLVRHQQYPGQQPTTASIVPSGTHASHASYRFEQEEAEASWPDTTPRNRSTTNRSCDPPVSARQRRLQLEALLSASVTPSNVLQDPSTPQHQALQWLVDEDGACPNERKAGIQRYVLATLYFAMGGGGGWGDDCTGDCGGKDPFLSASNVCEWEYVVCPQSSDTIVKLNIDATNTGRNGYLPLELANLDILHSLAITNNPGLGRRIPLSFGNFRVLRHLDLQRNALTADVPVQLCQLITLKTLNVAHNHLTGEIPGCLGLLGNLGTLDLSHNAISGVVPVELFDSIACHTLHLEYNQLTGPLPEEIGLLSRTAVDLSFSRNSLTGQLPSSVGDLHDLQFLSLFGNQLTGPIPSELGKLPQLERLFLHLNDLSGSMPREICDLRLDRGGKLAHLTADCGAKGTVVCDCCTACF